MSAFWMLALTACMADPVPASSDVNHVGPRSAPAEIAVTHGVAAGGVTSDSAILWARAERAAEMHVLIREADMGRGKEYHLRVGAQRDFTGKIAVTGLKPDHGYTYTVWFTDGEAGIPPTEGRGKRTEGFFRTAPAPATKASVGFAWSGDLSGQNVCRDAEDGFPIFEAVNGESIDFFIALGDMIYADNRCVAAGRDDAYAHHR